MRKGRVNRDVAGPQKSPEKEDDHCTCSVTNGSEVVNYVCRNCQQPICSYCKFANHRNHELQTVETVAEEIRNDITKYVSGQKKEEKMSSIHKTKQMIADMKKELVVLETQEVDKIDQRLNELKNKLDEIRTELVQKVTDVVRQDLDNLNKAERDLNRTAANITKMCDAADQMIAEANDVDVVRRGYSFCDELNEMFKTEISSPTKGQAFNVEFIVAATDSIRLIDLVGKVDSHQSDLSLIPVVDSHQSDLSLIPVVDSLQSDSSLIPGAKSSSAKSSSAKASCGPYSDSQYYDYEYEEEPYLSDYDYEYDEEHY